MSPNNCYYLAWNKPDLEGPADKLLFSVAAKATYAAIAKTYGYLTPDLWKETVFTMSPIQEFTDYLVKNHRQVAVVQPQE